jgi:ABC-type antimicrobial peptide transport system permease subunit
MNMNRKPPRSWFWTPPVEQEVDEELAFHLDMHTRDLIATTSNVLAMVFGSTAWILSMGVFAGLTAAALVGRSMSTLLFGVQPIDPLTFAAAALVLSLTAMVATAVPALRAARVDPLVTLRDE